MNWNVGTYIWDFRAAAVDADANIALAAEGSDDVGFVSLLDDTGTSVWNRTIQALSVYGYETCSPKDMIFHNSHIYVLLQVQGGGLNGTEWMSNESICVVKYDMTGDVVWARVFRNTQSAYPGSLVYGNQITANGTNLYITGMYLPDSISTHWRQYVIQLGTNGTLYAAEGIWRTGESLYENCGVSIGSDGLIRCASTSYPSGSMLTAFDSNFNLEYRKALNDTDALVWCCASQGWIAGGNYDKAFIARLSNTGTLDWANRLAGDTGYQEFYKIGHDNSSLYVMGDVGYWIVARVPDNGTKTGNYTVPASGVLTSTPYEYQPSTNITSTSTDTSINHADITDDWTNEDAFDLGFESTAESWAWTTTTTLAHPIVRF